MSRREIADTLTAAVTGGRDFTDKKFVWRALTRLMNECRYLELVNGGCPTGVDKFAREWAECHKNAGFVTLITVPADWANYGRAAGPIRNHQMLEEHCVELLLAFPGNRGTASCVRAAKELGIEIRSIRDSVA